MFTYLFGPVLRVPTPGTIFTPSQHPCTLAAGGGVDVSASHSLAIRAGEFDYALTRDTGPLTSTNNQNSFRYTARIVLKF
jgi:hypothetical protein